MDRNEQVERAILDVLISQGWREAPVDFPWDSVDPHDPKAPVKYDFFAVMRLMKKAEVRERQESLRIVKEGGDVSYSEIDEDCRRWAARNGASLSAETLERMRRAREKAQGISDDPERVDGQ